MSAIELTRTALTVTFAAVAVYSAARLAWSVAPKAVRTGRAAMPGERISSITHALMGLFMAAMFSPYSDAVPAVAGVLVFGALAVWFVALLQRHGVTSRAGADGRGGHGGYNVHHLAGCVAMVYMFVTGHGFATGGGAAASPDAGAASLDTGAASVTLMAHHGLASLTSLSWLFGLYFLVAATSLGFRVAEPAVRVTYRAAVPAGFYPPPASRPAPVRLLSSSAGTCAAEVIMSGGMALMFFTSL